MYIGELLKLRLLRGMDLKREKVMLIERGINQTIDHSIGVLVRFGVYIAVYVLSNISQLVAYIDDYLQSRNAS